MKQNLYFTSVYINYFDNIETNISIPNFFLYFLVKTLNTLYISYPNEQNIKSSKETYVLYELHQNPYF